MPEHGLGYGYEAYKKYWGSWASPTLLWWVYPEKKNKLDFSAEFTIDIRGRMGHRGVVPHFKTVRLEVLVDTKETEAKLSEVVNETEARCPVYNLIKDAGVNIQTQWLIKG